MTILIDGAFVCIKLCGRGYDIRCEMGDFYGAY